MNVIHIAVRELRATFNTTLGWLVLAGFLFISGFFWASSVSVYVISASDLVANPYAAQTMTLTDHLMAPFFGNTSVVLLMMTPALSMRLFSEELKQRTLELLLTSPVSTFEIVLGKFLGAFGFVFIMLACTGYGPAMLYYWGTPDTGAGLCGYLALLLTCSSILSMGMFFSAMTDNQVVALVWTFSSALALWILHWAGDGPDSFWGQLCMYSHVKDLWVGVVNVSDLVYFAAFIGFFLFATHQRVESHRWS